MKCYSPAHNGQHLRLLKKSRRQATYLEFTPPRASRDARICKFEPVQIRGSAANSRVRARIRGSAPRIRAAAYSQRRPRFRARSVIRSGSAISQRICEFAISVRNRGSAANSQIHCEFAAAANLQRIREFSQNHIYKCKTEVLGGSNGTVAQSIKNASKKVQK